MTTMPGHRTRADSRRYSRGVDCRWLTFKVASTKPQAPCIPNHVCAQNKLNQAAPDVFPSVSHSQEREGCPPRSLVQPVCLRHHQTWSAVGTRASVGGRRIKRIAPEHLAYHRAHCYRCQSGSRTWPVSCNTKWDVVLLVGQQILPAVWLKVFWMFEARAMVVGMIEAKHRTFRNSCFFVDDNVR